MNAIANSLLDGFPSGRVQYVRDTDHNRWGVAIFAPGTVALLFRVAEGMDKNAAAWLALAMIDARPDKFTGTDNPSENQMASMPGALR